MTFCLFTFTQTSLNHKTYADGYLTFKVKNVDPINLKPWKSQGNHKTHLEFHSHMPLLLASPLELLLFCFRCRVRGLGLRGFRGLGPKVQGVRV